MGRMITVSLEDALRAGTFGPLAPGMTRAQVASLVGPPDAMGSTSRKYRTPRIWKYGDIEVRYELGADRLTTVALREFVVPTGGATIHLDPWVICGHMARQEAEDALDRAGLHFRYVEEGDVLSVVLASGATLMFVEEQEAYGVPMGLYGVDFREHGRRLYDDGL
jgi:hypothetical protein